MVAARAPLQGTGRSPRVAGRHRVRAHAASGADRSLSDHVVVVGGGIAGFACALAMKREGFQVTVLEASKEKREGGTAIALWKNAWRALEVLGVADELRAGHQELNQVQLCASKGKVLRSFSFDECDGGPHEFRGVYRKELLRAMESKLDVRYGVEVKEASTSGEGALLRTSQGEALECRAVVGCDGVGSKVCESLGLPKPNFSGYSAIRGVATFASDLPIPSNTVRQIMGSGMRAGLYPINKSDVYWYVCFNSEADWARTCRREEILDKLGLFSEWNHSISEAITATDLNSISVGSISDRWLIPFQRGVGVGNITVAGDALHPMTPNLGQGGCCALEDAVVLSKCLARGQGTVEEALREYERERLKRCFPLTVRANLMGALLQIGNPVVTGVRDAVIERAFSPAHFLDHTNFDCRV